MRIFTAIPFPDAIKKIASELFKGRLPVSYVNTTNLHITLNFFGELTDDELTRVKKVFSSLAKDLRSFKVNFDMVAKFSQQIHLTLKSNPDLIALQQGLERSFNAEGFRFKERSYYPHVKLANLHMDHVMNKERKLENFPNQELSKLDFTAAKIVLYESRLLLHHAHHNPVMETTLI